MAHGSLSRSCTDPRLWISRGQTRTPPSIRTERKKGKTIFLFTATDPLPYLNHRGDSLPLSNRRLRVKNLQDMFSGRPGGSKLSFNETDRSMQPRPPNFGSTREGCFLSGSAWAPLQSRLLLNADPSSLFCCHPCWHGLSLLYLQAVYVDHGERFFSFTSFRATVVTFWSGMGKHSSNFEK